MNKNKHLNSKNESQKVVSEYFKNNNVMDESSDFHEKKDFKNLKNLPKSNNNSKKKPVKKIRGQKDIRAALKSKKNDLISYSKEFDKVCKKSGIDVDSEQLQLAVALSKSLNDQVDLSPSCSTENLNVKGISNKIRTTLQEYGFTVPAIKIEKSVNKRTNKHRKPYKLLTTDEFEKKHVILDRYAQVLSATIHSNTVVTIGKTNNCAENKLQYLATNASYESLKNIETFYIKGLLQISQNSIGSLLKDWATIPCRPVSPLLECTSNFKFEDINCTQCELDTILSGTVEVTHNLIVNMTKGVVKPETDIETKEKTLEIVNMKTIDEANGTNIEHTERSCSPDIFDDEVSLIMDKSANKTVSEATIKDIFFMDLTDCVQIPKKTVPNATFNKTVFSQGSNVTKRKSNDFMEITNCMASSSQPIIVNACHSITVEHYSQGNKYCEVIEQKKKEHNVDLFQDNLFVQVHTNNVDEQVSIENVDLTQSSDSCELPAVSLNHTQKDNHEDTIILHDSEYIGLNTPRKYASTDNETGNDFGPKDIVTIYSDADEILDLTQEIRISPSPSIEYKEENKIEQLNSSMNESFVSNATMNKDESNSEAVIKLTQSSEKSNDYIENYTIDCKSTKVSYSSLGKSDNMSLDYDEVINIDHDERAPIINGNSSIKENEYSQVSSNKLDSSQTSEVFEINDNELNYSMQKSRVEMPSAHFEFDDEVINIDHDKKAPKSINVNVLDVHKSFNSANKIENFNTSVDEKSQALSNKIDSSQTSEVFEIYDNELDYFVQKSRLEMPSAHFELGGLSILDNVSKCSSNDIESMSREITGSFHEVHKNVESSLDGINVKSINDHEYKPSTPLKDGSSAIVAVQTPRTEYIIKTDQVTPMLDYSSMDTPDRNKELEKYGLKPFKRKRAIQLLTHLYNQTHPLVENISEEDLPSPSKKPKTASSSKIHSSNIQSPRKITKSPKKKSPKVQRCKDYICENLHEVTNETPAIRDLECDPEDYVFQKREKAKVHSCRLPLHIAFHNYVSSRSGLREAILRYEPINIDEVHKDLVATGHRYDPKDLLKFLDKKCITVKTADNNSRNLRK